MKLVIYCQTLEKLIEESKKQQLELFTSQADAQADNSIINQ